MTTNNFDLKNNNKFLNHKTIDVTVFLNREFIVSKIELLNNITLGKLKILLCELVDTMIQVI